MHTKGFTYLLAMSSIHIITVAANSIIINDL